MSSDTMIKICDVPTFVCSADGPTFSTPEDVLDVVGFAFLGAEMAVLPVERLGSDFFDLSTGLAGMILQKFVNYRMRLIVLGDISAHLEKSEALQALVHESNLGQQVWFMPTMESLQEKISSILSTD